MPLPSLWVSEGEARVWNVARAAGYGAALGAFAAVLKTVLPLHEPVALGASAGVKLVASVPEILGAVVAFAVLCAGAAALRNLIARRLIWPDIR